MMSQKEVQRVMLSAEEYMGHRVDLVKEIKRGDRNTTLLIICNDQQLIVKYGLDVDTDIKVLSLLQEYGVSAPMILGHSQLHTGEAVQQVLIMNYIDGVRAMEMSSSKKARLMPRVLESTSRLRNITCEGDGCGAISKGKEFRGTWKNYLSDTFHEAVEILTSPIYSNELVMDKGLREAAINTINLFVSHDHDIRPSLIHNDLNLTNFIVGHNGNLTIIDWSDAIYGDWLYDHARLKMNLAQLGETAAVTSLESGLDLSDVERSRYDSYYLLKLVEYMGIYRKYGSSQRFAQNNQLLRMAII